MAKQNAGVQDQARYLAASEDATLQLIECQAQLAQAQQLTRTLQQNLGRQTAVVQEGEQKIAQQARSMNATIQQHNKQLMHLKEQHRSRVQELHQQLTASEHQQQLLHDQLQQERSRFEAALLSGTNNAYQTHWKDKFQAARAELEVMKRERHATAMASQR